MYLDYFGLKLKPFLITPDPAFLYPSQHHQQALAHLRYGLQREGGFLLLTGEVGTGKTTLCRLLMDELPADFRLAYLLNTKLDSAGVLAGICRELNIAVEDARDVNQLVSAIYDDLLRVHGENRHTLVVIEEAQNLAPDVLETLRLLTNLETSSTKLLHILLIGQPELLETLAQPGLRQLNQRVVSRCHLGPLSGAELHHYIAHRVTQAGSARPLFTRPAIKVIHRRTGGIPRLVNLLAEHCLMGAYGNNQEKVTAAIARQAAREMRDTLATPNRGAFPWRWALLLILVSVSALAYWQLTLLPTINKPVAEMPAAPEPVPADENPVDEAVVAQNEVDETVNTPQTLNPAWIQLLQQWQLTGLPPTVDNPCELAASSGLQCHAITINSLDDLVAVNRPMVVNIAVGVEGWQQYALLAMKESQLTLSNTSGVTRLNVAEFLDRFTGEATMLWRPPEGYDRPLLPGEANGPLVDYLVQAFTERGYITETLVTGGVYSDFMAEIVKQFQRANGLDDDGIVGVNTLLSLDARDGPRLFTPAVGEPL